MLSVSTEEAPYTASGRRQTDRLALHTSSLAAASSLLDLASNGGSEACGVGEWSAVWLGTAGHLENGVERDWSFNDVILQDGEVINVSPLQASSASNELQRRKMS